LNDQLQTCRAGIWNQEVIVVVSCQLKWYNNYQHPERQGLQRRRLKRRPNQEILMEMSWTHSLASSMHAGRKGPPWGKQQSGEA
jgi:hypothetical protein